MYLEVTNFGDEKTLVYLEKVILWLYNFTRGFHLRITIGWSPPPPVWFKCLCLRLENGPKIQTRGLCWIFTFG